MMRRNPARIRLAMLLKLIDEGYERKTWHGPNLRGSLRGLTPQVAAWRPARGRHNIWEVIVHAAYWKYIMRRRLLGEKRGSFPLKGSDWFGRPESATASALKADLALLEECHRTMRAAIAAMKPSHLSLIAKGSTVTNEAMIYGIAFHDVYHAGQIQLLKRLHRTRR